MTAADAFAERIIAQENHLWDALRHNDVAAFRALVADDAIMVNGSGRVSGQHYALNVVPTVEIASVTLADFQVVPLSDSAGIVTYSALFRGAARGESLETRICISTAWTQRGETWVAVFSQDSPGPIS